MKKTVKNAAFIAAALMAALAFFGCKTNSGDTGETPDTPVPADTADTTAPADVQGLAAAAKDSCVLLTWTDAQDSDIFGYEVTYAQAASSESKSAQIRAIAAMEKDSIFVAQGSGGAYVNNLANGTEYTFTVKAMDTSGNKSSGVSVSSSPKAASAGETLKIALSASVPHENDYTGDKSNTTVTITAEVTSAAAVKNAVYKKNGSVNAAALLSDTSAVKGTQDGIDSSKWMFTIRAESESEGNGTYTVAAIDEAGREETAQISITSFDFTPPERVTAENFYSETDKTVELSWTEPDDVDFAEVKITFVTNDGTSDSEPSQPMIRKKGNTSITFENIDDKKAYYKYSIVSVDDLGNESVPRYVIVSLTHASDVPEGFCKVDGVTIEGNETWNPTSNWLFKTGRKLQIPALFVCDHEVTRAEYEDVIGVDPSKADAYDKTGSKLEGSAALNNPVDSVDWVDAIIYCNKRSEKEGLNPCYSYTGKDGNTTTDPDQWEISHNTSVDSSKLHADMKCDFNENGYRLPTEIEWEWSARGGQNYKYAGSDTLDDVAWYKDNSDLYTTREVKAKNPNGYGLYDMSGNVFEWCWDLFASITTSTPEAGPDSSSDLTSRIYRGGACGYNDSVTSSYFAVNTRSNTQWYSRNKSTGFRVVRNAN